MPMAPALVAYLAIFLNPATTQSLVQRTEWLEGRGGYSVEDFLWSGSGDDGSGEEPPTAWVTTTVFRTLLTTVYPTPVFPCLATMTGDCFLPSPTSAVPILPSASPSLTTAPATTPSRHLLVPDQSYWIATVIRHNASLTDLDPILLEQRLAEVYSVALRREEGSSWDVGARLHQVRRSGRGVELAWSVSVAGRPQPPPAALRTLAALPLGYFQTALGYPILQQPESYLKSKPELEIASPSDTWKLVGIIVLIFCIILILLILFLIVRGKKMKSASEEPSKAHEGVQTMLAEGDLHGKTHWSLKTSTERDVYDAKKQEMGLDMTGNGRKSSPTSFLSMPSIKAFPRDDPLPVPIDKLLGGESNSSRSLSRHHSDTKDPGVIGPAVWDLHCHRFCKIEERKDVDEASAHRMRKRFHELLDDAFSIFSSKCPSPQNGIPTSPSPSRSSDKIHKDGRLVQSAGSRSRRAWDGRPRSAGPHPVVEPSWILSDSALRSTDPAVPLIEAIKQELDKFPAPPSTSLNTLEI